VTNRQWGQRAIPPALRDRYVAEGWWTDRTLGDLVAEGLRTKPDLRFNVRSTVHPFSGTIGDIDRGAHRLAGSLAARGIGPGSVVLMQMPNWAEAGIAFWAACYLGATVVPVVHFYGAKEVDYILRATEPDVIVTPDRFGLADHLALYSTLLADRPEPLWLVVGDTPRDALPSRATPFADLLDGDPLAEPVRADPDAAAVIGFTSGTTSNPKGVVHSHRTLGFEAKHLNDMYPHIGPPGITGAPVGHFIGMLNAFIVSLQRDRPINLIDVWDPAQVLKMMAEEGLGFGGGATFFLTSLLDHPDFTDAHLALMPFAGLGGSTVPIAVTERAEALGIKPYRSYGSTEHPSITGSTLSDPPDQRMRTDGKPLEGVEMRLDLEAGEGAGGEISSRGPDLCIGYTDPELTAAMFDADGWYRTGDVGVLDDAGCLTITDRVSDVIIRGGENISAQEVEELLLGLGSVAEVAVVGAPDERLGERAAAVVRLLPGGEAPSLDDVRTHLAAAGLAKQKWPESIHVAADLPRTPSGKVQKFRLRQQLRDGEAPGA
jgi:acyl-CoA synthetase